MLPDHWAILTLAAYALAAVACLGYHCLQCRDGWQAWVIHSLTRAYTTLMYNQRISQRCPFPAEGSGLVIANHRSPVDPFLLCSASQEKQQGHSVRILEFMTAREYCELGGFVGWVCRNIRCIPVDRQGKDMGPAKEALRRLKSGHLIGIFPEGRINTGDGLLPGNPGVAWLALRSQAPVLPAFIHDAPQGTSMVTSFITRTYAQVSYGDPIDLSEYYGRKPTPALLAEVTDILMGRLGALGHVQSRPCSYGASSNDAASTNGAP